jgi:hypothetical protein
MGGMEKRGVRRMVILILVIFFLVHRARRSQGVESPEQDSDYKSGGYPFFAGEMGGVTAVFSSLWEAKVDM